MPSFSHRPVLLSETLAALRPRTGGRYVDATVGGAGHALGILAGSSPNGWLFGCDRDGAALEAAEARLSQAGYGGRFELRRGNFAEMAGWVAAASCDGVLLDLGVSSPQLDEADRGFSFQRDGPLDMRMDRRQPLTAAVLVNTWDEAELARVLQEYGDEPQARRMARAIVRERAERSFTTTGQLAATIERLAPRQGRARHPATRVFQALRMAVNDESRSLQSGLAAACTLLKPGGRLAVITFHSLEDRIVKAFGRELSRDYTFPGEVDVPELRRPRAPILAWMQRRAICPQPEEVRENPRARTAQLRVLEKL
ncbi:MAG TPA: 16S rRNA (cytosine(1402)-N(4))-methyltransferase RsmH [Candidatus Saccharimonadales bacterium]|nr:16S rRNA (cytosine(1402)-N(4))-methyltransferase RsmH [Candidatus Saccharimonadales bacterium]